MNSLPRIRSGLLRHPLDKQVIVYDSRDDRVHLLDPTTGCVLELLEEGGWTPDEITAEITARLDVSPNPGFLALALEELRKAGLLDSSSAPVAPMVDVTRRDLVRKLAMTGAAALLVPAVATLTATRGYAQGSGQLGAGRACTLPGECISGDCCLGICSATGCPQANGAACTTGTQCSSGSCVSGICTAVGAATCAPCSSGAQCLCGTCGSGGACCGANKAPTGAACGGGGNCCSGTCTGGVCA